VTRSTLIVQQIRNGIVSIKSESSGSRF